MRHLSFTVLCLALSHFAIAQVQFTTVFGGESYDRGAAIRQAADLGYFVAGTTGSFWLDNSQIVLVRFDEQGAFQYHRLFGGPFADVAEDMDMTADGGVVIAGFTETLEDSYQALVIRTDANGQELWSRTYGGQLWDMAKGIRTLPDGGYIVAGQTFSRGAGQGDVWLLRLTASGDTVWTRTFGTDRPEGAESVSLTLDGGFILSGFVETANGDMDALLLRTDSNGNLLWSRTFGEAHDDIAYGVTALSNGSFAFAGAKGGGGPNNYDFWKLLVTADGDSVSQHLIGGPNDDVWFGLTHNEWDELIAVGYSADSEIGKGQDEVFVSRVSWNYSNLYWNFGMLRTYGTEKDEWGIDIIRANDGGFAFVGWTEGYHERLQDIMVVKTIYTGHTEDYTVGIAEEADERAGASVFPNPVREIATFRLPSFAQLAASGQGSVAVEVMDAIGSVVYRQAFSSEALHAGLGQLSPGVYSYRIMASGRTHAVGRLVRVD